MIVYRKATLADIPELVKFALEYAKSGFPELIADPEKIRRLAVECISGAPNYAWVVEQDKKILGALVALVHDALWSERKIANVLLWFSRVKGAGVHMLRDLRAWVSTRRGIRFAGVTPMASNWDSRIALLLVRCGFQDKGGTFVWYN